jgi:hypothetical protein
MRIKKDIQIKKFRDLSKEFINYIELNYGPIDIVNDFFDNDLKTYFKTYYYDYETKHSAQYIIKIK